MKLYELEKNNIIRCLACAHYCVIPEGRSGLCGVRENRNGRMELLVYGRPCSVNIDPIEKKPLYHFLPGSEILSLGTFGCNLGCSFCQNWDISQVSRKDSAYQLNWRAFLGALEYWPPERVVDYALKNQLPSIAYTYNEPTIWSEYAYDIARFARAHGLKNVYVTNGYMTEQTLELVGAYLDAANVDLKSFSKDFYIKTCKAKIEPVLQTIKSLVKKGVWVEVTTLLIPHLTDSEEDLRAIAGFLSGVSKDIPWHLTPFHGDYRMEDHETTSQEALELAKRIGEEAGLRYVYAERTRTGADVNTHCRKCHELLVERGYMWGRSRNIVKGKCGKCGEKIPGVFG